MTQVIDTVYRADGVTAAGTVLISWPAFTKADGYAVLAGSLTVTQPAGVYYKVVYPLDGQ